MGRTLSEYETLIIPADRGHVDACTCELCREARMARRRRPVRIAVAATTTAVQLALPIREKPACTCATYGVCEACGTS